MIYSHYNPHEWEVLEPGERAEAVAFYRLSRLVNLHEQDAVNSAMRKAQS